MADFDLNQTGQEVQDILDGAAMQTDLTAETERAELAEQTLQGGIDAEETRAKAAEKQNADDIDVIESKIPAGASSENQLADKQFVNSSIATATATYRGAYNLVNDLSLTVDATHEQIAAALTEEIATADNNDYCFVQIPTADATPTQIASIERYKFNGTAWLYEYTLNNSGFTADQWAAINSGITSGLVAKLNALPTNEALTLALAGKQDTLTFDNVPVSGSNNPVKSGGVYSAIDDEATRAKAAEKANADDIDDIEAMIPAAASDDNQLADKQYVNDGIATASATYRGSFNEVSDLSLTIAATHAQIETALAGAISTADNNDYCFVQIPTADATPTQIAAIERYKFNGSAWAYEYTLNNSGFTADQWAALNSGITSGLVAKLSALPTNDALTLALAGKQDVLTFDNEPTSGSSNPVKSGGVYSAIDAEATTRAAAIAAIIALIPEAASALNQLADKAFVNSSISTATAIFKGTFNVVVDLELNYNASQQQIATMLASKIISADNNDYSFVQIPTSNETPLQIARTDRYKFNGTAWAYEYTLNNSGFTAAQWAAINSGITSLLKDKLIDLPTATELTTLLAAKQNTLTFDTTPTTGSTNPVTSGGIKSAIDAEKARALAAEQGLQEEYDELYELYQTLEGGSIVPVAAADWPLSNLQQNIIYRVANSATPTAYSDYMYDGTNTILLATFTFPGIDAAPTAGSQNLAYSGGTFSSILQNGPAFDLSAHNAANGVLATYADLSAALTALNALSADYKIPGMSLKFVCSSDNKYVQFRCIADEFTIDVTKWAMCDDGILVENPEFIDIHTDADKKIIWGVKVDGTFYFATGCPPQIKEFVLQHKAEMLAELATKVDKIEGKGLSTNDYTDSAEELVNMNELKEYPEFMSIEADLEGKMLGGRKSDGTRFENMPLETPSSIDESMESDEYINLTTDKHGRIIEGVNQKGKKIFGEIPPQILQLIEEIKSQNKKSYIDISDGVAINNGLDETTACGSQFAFDLKTGMAAVWVSSAWLEYGEKFGKSQLIIFPIAQPNNRKYVTFDVKGQEYTATVPWNNTTTTYTSVGLNVANLMSLGNGVFRILYFDGNYAWMYRDYNYISDTLADPVYIEFNYDGGNKKLNASCLIDYLTAKGIDVTDQSTRYSYSDFSSPIQKVNNVCYCAFAGYNTYPVLFSSNDNFESVTPFAIFPTKCDYEASFVVLNGAIHYIHRNYEYGTKGYTLGKSTDNGDTWQTKLLLTGDNNRPRMQVYDSKIIVGYGVTDDIGRNRRRVRYEIGTDIMNMQKMFDLEDRWGQVYFSMQFINGEMYLVWSDAQSGINSQAETQAARNDLRNCMKFKIINEFINV